MKLIRQSTGETVQLEDGFLWSDEFDYKPIEQTQERAVDGTLIIQEGVKKSGRPITLVPPIAEQGWVKRADVSKLKDWSALNEQYTLVFEYPHDKRRFNVLFNHAEGAIEAKPVKETAAISDEDYYSVTLRFIEV